MSMQWLKHNGYWLILNLFAVIVMGMVIRQGRHYQTLYTFSDPLFENSGRWAIRFLLFSLAMTPLNTLFGWRGAIKLRKPAGLWAFAFGLVHLLAYLSMRLELPDWNILAIVQEGPFVYLGIAGLFMLSLLALTSNHWAMNRLGKMWKRLHRGVYLAGMAVIIHALWAGMITKRGWIRDDGMAYEFRLYFAILVILLALRIPPVKRAAQIVIRSVGQLFRPLIRPLQGGES